MDNENAVAEAGRRDGSTFMSTSGSFSLGNGNRARNDEAELLAAMTDDELFRLQQGKGHRLLDSEIDGQMCVETCRSRNEQINL